MAPRMRIYAYPNNKNSYKAFIAAKYVGCSDDIEMAPAFEMGVTNKSPAFLMLNPHGKVPTMETSAFGIFESNAIARYVARQGFLTSGLMGGLPIETAQIEAWMDLTSSEIDNNALVIILPKYGMGQAIPAKEAFCYSSIHRALAAMETHLAGGSKTCLVGGKVTLADIVAVINLFWPLTQLLDAAAVAPYPHVVRYFQHWVAQPQFKEVMGEVKLCEKPM